MAASTGSTAGYSGTPLARKLGLKPGGLLLAWNAPNEFFSWLEPLGPESQAKQAGPRTSTTCDVAVVFASELHVMERSFLLARSCLVESGGLWICWPKKSSGVPTELSDLSVREFGLSTGMVDNKVCAISEIWSGLRFVIRVTERKRTPAQKDKASSRRSKSDH
jgi:hypothetical protein